MTDSPLATVLKDHSQNITRQRLVVFNLLNEHEQLSMAELYELAKTEMDRASIYRITKLFERLGIVQRVNLGWKYKLELSGRFAAHHHHLTCSSCQRVIPISEIELEDFISRIARRHKFKPAAHQVEIQGICQACQIKNRLK